jgi:hypothetical protein
MVKIKKAKPIVYVRPTSKLGSQSYKKKSLFIRQKIILVSANKQHSNYIVTVGTNPEKKT